MMGLGALIITITIPHFYEAWFILVHFQKGFSTYGKPGINIKFTKFAWMKMPSLLLTKKKKIRIILECEKC